VHRLLVEQSQDGYLRAAATHPATVATAKTAWSSEPWTEQWPTVEAAHALACSSQLMAHGVPTGERLVRI
jgi:hypothetical protein